MCAVGIYNNPTKTETQTENQTKTQISLFTVGIGSGDSNRQNGLEVRNDGTVYINYVQNDDTKWQGKQNINEATYIDQTGPTPVKITYMSIQDVFDWLAVRIKTLEDQLAINNEGNQFFVQSE